jgi:Cyclic nucleotide-binding domain
MTLVGFRAFRESRPRVIFVFLSGVLDVAIIVLAFEVFGSEDAGTAWPNAVIGVGAAAGSVLAVVLIGRRHLASSMWRGLVLIAVSVSLIPIFQNSGSSSHRAGRYGCAGWTLVDVSGRIMLQRVIPLGGLSRAFGVLEGSSMAAEALGSAAGAALIGWLGVGWALVIAGLLIVVLLIVNRRALQDADVGVVVPIQHLHLLRSIPMFAALGPAELERLATSAGEESVGPGSAVCVQGELGERFYLVERGTARVVRDGVDVASLGSGDFFREIALLRDIPDRHRRGNERSGPTGPRKGTVSRRHQVIGVPDRGRSSGLPDLHGRTGDLSASWRERILRLPVRPIALGRPPGRAPPALR